MLSSPYLNKIKIIYILLNWVDNNSKLYHTLKLIFLYLWKQSILYIALHDK